MPDPINWSLALPSFATALFLGYLLGSIPFGLIFARMAGLGDIRKIGSGNIGATNVLRTGKIGVAVATLAADMGKGMFAYWYAEMNYGQDLAVLAGLGAYLGHCFPVWLKFKGGKGVATFFGILFPILLKAAFIFAAIWILIAGLTRYSSLAGIIASLIMPPSLFFLGYAQAGELYLVLSAIVIFKHRSNIVRLVRGEESKIKF